MDTFFNNKGFVPLIAVSILTCFTAYSSPGLSNLHNITHESAQKLIGQDEHFKKLYEDAKSAKKHSKDGEAILKLETISKEYQACDPEVYAHLLSSLAAAYLSDDEPRKAIDTLRSIKEVKGISADKEEKIAYWADVEIARILTEVFSLKTEFKPTMPEIDAAYEQLFSTYSPYRQGIIKAHLDYSMRAYDMAPQLTHFPQLRQRRLAFSRKIGDFGGFSPLHLGSTLVYWAGEGRVSGVGARGAARAC